MFVLSFSSKVMKKKLKFIEKSGVNVKFQFCDNWGGLAAMMIIYLDRIIFRGYFRIFYSICTKQHLKHFLFLK